MYNLEEKGQLDNAHQPIQSKSVSVIQTDVRISKDKQSSSKMNNKKRLMQTKKLKKKHSKGNQELSSKEIVSVSSTQAQIKHETLQNMMPAKEDDQSQNQVFSQQQANNQHHQSAKISVSLSTKLNQESRSSSHIPHQANTSIRQQGNNNHKSQQIPPSPHYQSDIIINLQSHYPHLSLFQKCKKKGFSRQQLMKYICKKMKKIDPNHPILKQQNELNDKMFVNQRPITAQQYDRLVLEIKECLDRNSMGVLLKMGMQTERAERILQISQNNLQKAIQISISGEESYIFSVQKCSDEMEQSLFLHQWLLHPSHRILLLKFKASLKYFNYYTLSIKHRCPQLFKLFIKHRNLVLEIVKGTYVHIYSNTAEQI